ncbi:DUF2177 family protein [Acidisoma cladoniae]|jgi:uncharacterized membrane protein|uniref:DUF2177 family protein n=1 Tax=Acidisoma cladoniae TaxID=3040935 RepID=UPI0025509020|nr:DUF2177 family protein [Acidisoma sp. PAMC 29798]
MIILAYIAGLIVFVALDAVWLTLTGPSYRAVLGDMLAPSIRIVPAVLFYLVDMLGIMIFVARPGVPNGIVWVLTYGALFGLFTYATYDLTNFAILKNWNIGITVADILWGSVLSSAVSTAAWAVLRRTL